MKKLQCSTFKIAIMYTMKQKTKVIAVDIVGFALIIIAPFLGWLPGPGGIPLLILGLSLLATNHEWAERIMLRVKNRVAEANRRVTEADPATKWAIDIMSVIFIAGGVLLMTQFTKSLVVTSGISFIIAAVIMLASNQNRHKRVWAKLRRKHKQQ